jgi:putative hydrolase of the HAD superfamily
VPADPRFRAIAFDLFHTLVDPEEFQPKGFRRTRAVAERLRLPLEEFERAWEAEYRDRQVTRVPTVVDRVRAYCAARGVTPPESVWPEVEEILGRTQDLAILRPAAGVVATLRELRARGWRLGLISNCDERESRAWPRSVLAPLFDATVLSWEVGAAKPEAAAFGALVPRWGGVPLRDAIFVGDGSNGEIPGARAAGFGRVVFQSGFVATNGLRTAAEIAAFAQASDATVSGVADLLRISPPDGLDPASPP